MLLPIATFEVKKATKRLSTYVYFAVFFALGFFWMVIAGGGIPGASGEFASGEKVFANAPQAVATMTATAGYFGCIITAAIAGRATFQDVEARATAFFFTAPISKLQYLGGRFLGSFAVVLLLYPAIGLGERAATLMPFLDATRFETTVSGTYVQPYLTFLLPNLLFLHAIFFSLAALTRKMQPVYVGGVVLMLGYLIASGLSGQLENKTLAAMLDPFGLRALDRLTQYWSVSERNGRLVPLEGILLWNRAAWSAAAIALSLFTFRRFRFEHGGESSARGAAKDERPETAAPIAVPRATKDFGARATWRVFGDLTRLQLRETLKNTIFGVIVLAAVLFVAALGTQVTKIFGTETYPVTPAVISIVGGSFVGLFLPILITVYAGELTWRERDAGIAQIVDALPVPRWTLFTSKLLALMAVQPILLGVAMACGVVLQTVEGYFHYEIPLYLESLFLVELPTLWILCTIAMLVHALVNQKALGHFAMVLFFVARGFMRQAGLEHHLWHVGGVPRYPYSAMNGFGHYLAPMAWYTAYWGAFAVACALAANLFWVRGVEAGARWRLAQARARISRPIALALAATTLAFAGAGGFIFYETTVAHTYRTAFQEADLQADYEKLYSKYGAMPAAKLTDVVVRADLHPSERKARFAGTMTLENTGELPVTTVAMTMESEAHVNKLALSRPSRPGVVDTRVGFRTFELDAPLAPHEKTTLDFDVDYSLQGFVESGDETSLVANGSFIHHNAMPILGYAYLAELSGDASRRKHGLPPKVTLPPTDPRALARNYISGADWITLDATVSTDGDQLAAAAGSLVREWSEGGRHVYHYVLEGRAMELYGFVSARYATKAETYKGIELEVDYHPPHPYDVDRMLKGMKRSLDYATASFGPFQHHRLRIFEVPYVNYAQSMPSMIPFSEELGFVARVDEAKDDEVDYPFYITAHEVAHQWWAHQVVGANAQGSTVLSETLAQYTALMVMKHEYGEGSMRKFLKHELASYLQGRATESKHETPLVLVENEAYIHYNKGSLVMYALQDYVGEANVNRALAKLVTEHAFKGPPYPTGLDLLAALREVTPPEYQSALHDLFETITLFENRATKATYAKRADGKYDVTITARAKKLLADEVGAEKEVPLADYVDFGALDEKGKPLALERHHLDAADVTVTLVTDVVPAKAGIDPLNKLIDRDPDDNVVKVEGD